MKDSILDSISHAYDDHAFFHSLSLFAKSDATANRSGMATRRALRVGPTCPSRSKAESKPWRPANYCGLAV